MKLWRVFVLSLVLTFALSSTVFAAGPKPGKGPTTFSLSGEIVAVDSATNQVTVHVLAGNAVVKTSIGKDVTLSTTAATRFLLKDGTTTTAISIIDLKAGDSVSAGGKISAGVWTATRITVGASLIHY